MAKVGFGGGCHWCTEGVFQALRGVTQVDQGFLQSVAPADTWAEGVIVTFEPSAIGLETLSEVHLRTHSATRARSVQNKYRSAIYIFDESQRAEADEAIRGFAEETGKPVHTLVLPFAGFKASDVNRRSIGTPYRRAKGTPLLRWWVVDAGRGFRAADGVGRA